jgi:hypothetical protein
MGSRTRILEGLRQIYGVGADTLDEIIRNRDPRADDGLLMEEITQLDKVSEEEASVLKFVNHILRGALEQRATDIHLEPMEDRFRIRFRVDGVLSEVSAPANIKVIQSSVISRLLKDGMGLSGGSGIRDPDNDAKSKRTQSYRTPHHDQARNRRPREVVLRRPAGRRCHAAAGPEGDL